MSFYPAVREINPKPILRVNPQDAAKRGIQEGDLVRVFNDRGEMVVNVAMNPGIRPGTIRIEHGWKPKEFVSGFYNNLLHRTNLPDETAKNPVWTWYADSWQAYVDNAALPALAPFGLADVMFDVLCEFELYKA
jgi:anaerobic selenocysteine-containing dehydrogenase